MGTRDEHTLAELEAESRRIQELAAKLMAEIERILDEIERRDEKSWPPPDAIQNERDSLTRNE